jgi:hypothetical protein
MKIPINKGEFPCPLSSITHNKWPSMIPSYLLPKERENILKIPGQRPLVKRSSPSSKKIGLAYCIVIIRPNNPVNVYFGLLILREVFGQSDEEALYSLMFDIRYQYALHTTSFAEQPVSKNSLTNFRVAVYQYNQEHGVDLIQEEIEEEAKSFSELLKIDGHTIRMDSLMISSSCKKLSRLEIIYSTVARLTKVIDKNILPERFQPYQEEDHYNYTIYRAQDQDLNSKIKKILND